MGSEGDHLRHSGAAASTSSDFAPSHDKEREICGLRPL
jgi:hypothetical protein